MMKSRAWLFAAAMSLPCLALAQTEPQPTVKEINDPVKIAEIERHAQELASRQSTPAADEYGARKRQDTRVHKSKPKHKGAAKGKGQPETPMATDSKS